MRLIPATPPPGPFRPAFWRSPLRGPWLTSVLGLLLLAPLVIVIATGFLSHAAYQPDLGHNALIDPAHDFQPFIFTWPTSPSWLYALTQGLHVNVGIAAVPILLAKLWSVIPRLFAWPPVRSAAMAVERASLLLLVGGALFEFATGILNVQVFYPWHFSFIRAHYFGAWVFTSALIVHVAVKTPLVVRSLRTRRLLAPLRESLAETRPEPRDPDGLVPAAPAAPTISRRGLLALVGAGSLGLVAVTVGESVGGPLRRIALLAPRGGAFGDGPNDFPVNKTAVAVHIPPGAMSGAWRLELSAGDGAPVSLSREDLLGMELHTHDLPIACVEGWSTTQRWTGVRLADLGRLAGAPPGALLMVQSLQQRGAFRRTTLSHGQASDPRSLLALKVNGADLSPDHGYPARIIVPALPGVHCTKWVRSLRFVAA